MNRHVRLRTATGFCSTFLLVIFGLPPLRHFAAGHLLPLTAYQMKVRLAHERVGATEPLASIGLRHRAQAAINGCFFDAYTRDPIKPRNGSALLVTVPNATVVELAGVMRLLGAYNAMNLDGGASSGLWVEGRYLTAPGRDVSHALVIVKRP